MSKSVIIKGNNFGVNVIISPDLDFAEVRSQLRERFKASAKFFGKADMVVNFSGVKLDDDQIQVLTEIITDVSDINVVCVINSDDEEISNDMIREAYSKKRMEQAEEAGVAEREQAFAENMNSMGVMEAAYALMQQSSNSFEVSEDSVTSAAKIYHGTLRSGQVLEEPSSVVIIGDVNPGAKVIAGGCVIVLGSLLGNIQVGSGVNMENAFVLALEMNPMQIQIGDLIATSESSNPLAALRRRRANTVSPEIAHLKDGEVYIEDLSLKVINELKFN